MLFQSHMPSFIDADLAIPKQEFSSLNELLNHSWVKSWSEPAKKNFKYCWSLNETGWSKAHLMAEWEENGEKKWFVLGYIFDEIPNLPEWKHPSIVESI